MLKELREKNQQRQELWCPNGSPGPLFRSNELGGETGETLNEVKKLERERLGFKGSRTTVENLAKEIADVVICCDLLASEYGIDLEAAIKNKFNETSDKVGFPVRFE